MQIIDVIGNTPLVEVLGLSPRGDVRIFAKAEYLNPSGSVKDRAARAMILDGVESGKLTKEKIIADATSGNTGIAYAMIGAALGFKVRLYMPANASPERKRSIKHYGAEIVETDPLLSSDGAVLAVQKAIENAPEKYFYPDQYNNPVNPKTHYETTAVEILQQTSNKITHFVSVMGTSGTFVGTSRKLKEANPDVRTIAVQPDSPFHGIEGTKHMASTIKPGILDENLQDEIVPVKTEEAYAFTRMLAKKQGIFVGISSGANVAAAVKIAEDAPAESVIVTILCDSGSRYLSDNFWEPPKNESPFDWKI